MHVHDIESRVVLVSVMVSHMFAHVYEVQAQQLPVLETASQVVPVNEHESLVESLNERGIFYYYPRAKEEFYRSV